MIVSILLKRRKLAVAIIASLITHVAAYAQFTSIELEPLVTTATRIPESATIIGSSVDSIQETDLTRRQLFTLAEALGGTAGISTGPTGQVGANNSIFLRGANSNQTLFLIDGVALNDANVDYNVFVGGLHLAKGDSVEIIQGPQSTLYGSQAVGGVVSLNTARGSGKLSGEVSIEGGSFGTLGAEASLQGSRDSWGYNISASNYATDNERVNNRFTGTSLAVRLDKNIFNDLEVGITLRGLMDRYGDPSDEYTNDLYAYETEHNWLGTLFADAQLAQNLKIHVILGLQERNYSTYDFSDDIVSTTYVHNTRDVLDWQFIGQLNADNKLIAGMTADKEHTRDTGFGAINNYQTLSAYYLEDEARLTENAYLTLGARNDHYDTFGSASTGRATLALLSYNKSLKFRGSYATGFNAPSFLDLYGKDAYYVGNPHLVPETTKGVDLGFDFYFPNNAGSLSATWFKNDYKNLINYNFNQSPATMQNIDKARTDGIELSAKTLFLGSIKARIAYTYLKALNLTEDEALLRRPKNSGNVDLWEDITSNLGLGFGVTFVGERSDVNAYTYDAVMDPNYTVFRIYSNWSITQHVSVHARIENLLNRKYEPVNGYPATGLGIYGGIDWKF
jgi:vitamin B12 transporter